MKKYFIAMALTLCLPFSMSGYALAAENTADGSAQEIVIYHTNDTHGYLQGDGESIIGIDLVAG